ncbi:hypothetical protein HELRODRAFT_165459 [Helobdella robusta]|uniref:Uncharacterized protein n=1 Tax=Helobdella robusta TaxID=6412 RepID=T1EWU2_HELRO|nr:hypothetical protein HELRODRAFT_165459 [Helobdella robusta]ESN91424.1 hypothetical protein HELRODRAFT_165459 [Helobdella robusta]
MNQVDRINALTVADQVMKDERETRQWLRLNGLFYQEMICDNCGSDMTEIAYQSGLDGVIWRCPVHSCQKRTTIRKDSFFEKSHVQFSLLRSSMNFENRWVLRSALNFASDGEVGREFQRKGPEKQKQI